MIVPPLHRSRSPEVCGDGAMATSTASDEASEFLRRVLDENTRLKAALANQTEKTGVFEAALVDANWADAEAAYDHGHSTALAVPADTVAPEPAAPAARMEEAAEGLRVRLCLYACLNVCLSVCLSVSNYV